MSANLIGGFHSRLEGSRKYLFGSAAVYGEENKSVIAGCYLIRGSSTCLTPFFLGSNPEADVSFSFQTLTTSSTLLPMLNPTLTLPSTSRPTVNSSRTAGHGKEPTTATPSRTPRSSNDLGLLSLSLNLNKIPPPRFTPLPPFPPYIC